MTLSESIQTIVQVIVDYLTNGSKFSERDIYKKIGKTILSFLGPIQFVYEAYPYPARKLVPFEDGHIILDENNDIYLCRRNEPRVQLFHGFSENFVRYMLCQEKITSSGRTVSQLFYGIYDMCLLSHDKLLIVVNFSAHMRMYLLDVKKTENYLIELSSPFRFPYGPERGFPSFVDPNSMHQGALIDAMTSMLLDSSELYSNKAKKNCDRVVMIVHSRLGKDNLGQKPDLRILTMSFDQAPLESTKVTHLCTYRLENRFEFYVGNTTGMQVTTPITGYDFHRPRLIYAFGRTIFIVKEKVRNSGEELFGTVRVIKELTKWDINSNGNCDFVCTLNLLHDKESQKNTYFYTLTFNGSIFIGLTWTGEFWIGYYKINQISWVLLCESRWCFDAQNTKLRVSPAIQLSPQFIFQKNRKVMFGTLAAEKWHPGLDEKHKPLYRTYPLFLDLRLLNLRKQTKRKLKDKTATRRQPKAHRPPRKKRKLTPALTFSNTSTIPQLPTPRHQRSRC